MANLVDKMFFTVAAQQSTTLKGIRHQCETEHYHIVWHYSKFNKESSRREYFHTRENSMEKMEEAMWVCCQLCW